MQQKIYRSRGRWIRLTSEWNVLRKSNKTDVVGYVAGWRWILFGNHSFVTRGYHTAGLVRLPVSFSERNCPWLECMDAVSSGQDPLLADQWATADSFAVDGNANLVRKLTSSSRSAVDYRGFDDTIRLLEFLYRIIESCADLWNIYLIW